MPPESGSVPLRWRIVLGTLRRLPQGALSRVTGRLADVRIPVPLRTLVLGMFARFAGIEVAEAERPLIEYESVDAFFVRRLKPGARCWPDDGRVITSPVDGAVGEIGTITGGVLLQAKNRPYSAASLLDDAAMATRFEGGDYVTLYLSPRDYHRVHTPCAGTVALARHVPGALLPVNDPAIHHVPELFPRNERVTCYLDGPGGCVALVAIGAFNVGRIELVFDQGFTTNRRNATAGDRDYAPPVVVGRTDEVMVFHLGSTIVLLFEPGRVRLADTLRAGRSVRLGEMIGSLLV